MESLLEIALTATNTSTQSGAVEYLNCNNAWNEFADFINDPRIFVVDRKYTVDELKAELVQAR